MTKQAPWLRRYIAAYGGDLPPDIDSFKEGATYEHQCMFCSQEHSLCPVFKYDIINGTRQATGAHCCTQCDIPVQQMVKENYGDIYAEDIENGRAWDPEEGPHTNHYRLNLYNTVRRFDEHVNSFIIERNTSGTFRCYFCERIVQPDAPEIHVPVEGTSQVSGGRVKVCTESCYDAIWEGTEDTTDVSAKCSYCSGIYLITEEEFQRQRILESYGRHMCPTCVYSGIAHEQEKQDSILWDSVNRSMPYERFIHNTCVLCDEPVAIDLTMLHSRLKKIHTGPNNQCRCLQCFIFKVKKSGETFIFEINDYYCVIFFIDKRWSYRVSKVVNTEEKVHFRAPNGYGTTNLLEAISEASKAAESFGSQLELGL